MDTNLLFREFGKELSRAYDRASTTLPHYGERALERESALATLLNQRIPTRFRAARGFVLFNDGLCDKQIDCLVYDAFNYGTRSNLSGNSVVALSKSVAVLFLETLTLTREKFKEDVTSVERLKQRFETDTSYDPYSNTFLTQPLSFLVAHRALENGKSWDVLQAYQDEFQRLDKDGGRWRHLIDGILLIEPGDFIRPVAKFVNGSFSQICLNNVSLSGLPDQTILGLLPIGSPEDAGDIFFETIRTYLMHFKNPTILNAQQAIPLQINPPISGKGIDFKRCRIWKIPSQ